MYVKIEHLNLRRGAKLLVKDLNLSLHKGESLLVTGPNGVGKTTLIRAIAGFHTPEKGQITLNLAKQPDQTATDSSPLQENIHYIGHNNGLRASLTVLENLEFWAQFNGQDAPIAEIAKKFSLKSLLHIPTGYLSAGQKRRLGLARLNLKKRPLWLLDEPTVSLDKTSTKLLANAATDHLKQGGILIAATHIPLEIPFSQTIELTKPIDQEWEPLI